RFVAAAGPQRAAQVRLRLLPQAHKELAGTGDADAIARLAEIVAERRNEAQLAARLLDLHIACGAARAFGHIAQGPARRETLPHRFELQLVVWPAPDPAHRHGLDERHIHALPVCPFNHGHDLILVHAFERDHVDFDLEAGRARGFDAIEHEP